jgi:hypothetical protein
MSKKQNIRARNYKNEIEIFVENRSFKFPKSDAWKFNLDAQLNEKIWNHHDLELVLCIWKEFFEYHLNNRMDLNVIKYHFIGDSNLRKTNYHDFDVSWIEKHFDPEFNGKINLFGNFFNTGISRWDLALSVVSFDGGNVEKFIVIDKEFDFRNYVPEDYRMTVS